MAVTISEEGAKPSSGHWHFEEAWLFLGKLVPFPTQALDEVAWGRIYTNNEALPVSRISLPGPQSWCCHSG